MELKLPTLKYRGIRGVLIEVYKLLIMLLVLTILILIILSSVHVDINLDTRTRGHIKKSVVRRCRSDVRKYSFCITITNVWNSLPDEIIPAPSVNTFKNRLDNFWAEQEVFFYNYKANISGNKGIMLQCYI